MPTRVYLHVIQKVRNCYLLLKGGPWFDTLSIIVFVVRFVILWMRFKKIE